VVLKTGKKKKKRRRKKQLEKPRTLLQI